MEVPSYRVKPAKKRLRDTLSLSGFAVETEGIQSVFDPRSSPESTLSDRKRKKIDMDFFMQYSKEAPTKAPSSTAEGKPQRKRKSRDMFIDSHLSIRKTPGAAGSPERKQMSLEMLCDSQQASSSEASPSDSDCRWVFLYITSLY
ncbi:hypothetical protein GBF38_022565 [Nibea albiflora]|uniref:Uncharacterized protein n=1 Tax=Nibea albiflora TaxID=240163 RepID=A0ACB7FN10_NIBAL|nr:hypothetical protein GBF38_022565 [Nibea albiflora]